MRIWNDPLAGWHVQLLKILPGLLECWNCFLCVYSECSFLRPHNSYQGWPSVKILTKILNIWANRTICLQILFWIRDGESFFLILSTNSWINLTPQQNWIMYKINTHFFGQNSWLFFCVSISKIDNVLSKIRLYGNKSFWLEFLNRVAIFSTEPYLGEKGCVFEWKFLSFWEMFPVQK